MNSVISATTGAAYGAVPAGLGSDARGGARVEEFLNSARTLLAEANEHMAREEFDLALESAYRSALRTAGAAVAMSAVVKKRKRVPTSAWDKLRLTGVRGVLWADRLSVYSRIRGRVASGIELKPAKSIVSALVQDASAFLAEISGEGEGLSAA